jgi:hypothetical protein
MLSKNYFLKEKCELVHFEQVRRTIYALYPLRESRQMTECYLNLYCFADMRMYAGINGPLRKHEVAPEIAPAVRLEVLCVTDGDESFAFAREMIMKNNHIYRVPDDCINLLNDPVEGMIISKLEKWQKMVADFCVHCEEEQLLLNMKQLIDAHVGKVEQEKEIAPPTDAGEEQEELPAGENFTVAQSALCLHYFFQELGITEETCHKTDMAEFIARLTHRSEKSTRNKFYFDLESKSTKENLRKIYPTMLKLDPRFGKAIEKDLKKL